MGTMEKETVHSSRRPKLLTYEEIQEWSRDNEFIRTGYRPEKPEYKDIFLSLTYLHNETCNVYTHLIGAILVWPVAYIYMQILAKPEYHNVLPADYVMFIIFFFSCEFCLLSSAVYHLMQPHSHKLEQLWHVMDLTGIAVIIAGTFVAAIYYFFICQPAFQILHWVITIVSGSACVALISIPKFRTLRWRILRVVAFFLFGLSAFVPLLHGVGLHGSRYMFDYMGMKWYLIELSLYAAGTLIFATRPPERFAPGKFDLFGSSHQIFHLLILAAMWVNCLALTQSFRSVHTLDLCHR
ncbi:hypothetical protein J4E90_006917 [Alternaria incomplexa]|uniref:uncharacterized protein n=1 Tax=Alternaria incomplexa TaxID=1187928 RepID=UPI002220DB9E|nr:uncharacterized protein J4E90_006917 [Alternaria incomplexa]KAI4910662.1 hypothetical protein J4E90_006917 [Alternaria incomplexa]